MNSTRNESYLNITPDALRFIRYLEFKMDCAAYQEQNPVGLDYGKVCRHIDELEVLQEEKVEALKAVMPKVPKIKKKSKPKNCFKKDGTHSTHGEAWFKLLREKKLPPTWNKEVEVVSHYEDPNPNSTDQVKSWLYELGWKPSTYKYVRESDGSERKIEQVRKDGELSPCVVKLKDKAPEVEILEGLTIIQHRLGIFKGFKECAIPEECSECSGTGAWVTDREQTWEPCPKCKGKGKGVRGYRIKAEIGGLTNTLRFKHKKPLVNLPGVDKPWGHEIRSCLIATPGNELVGADMVSLESTTKRHYITPHDPDYANMMSQEGFDEHLDLAIHAGALTERQVEAHKAGKEDHSKVRKAFKPVNYSAVYGVGKRKLSRETGMTMKEAEDLLAAYWDRNWAVRVVAKEQYVKRVGGYDWLKNPVSGIYHELRYDKDRFSTTNQSTGVYLFDSWLIRAQRLGYNGVMQFHDETAGMSPLGKRQETLQKLETAIDKLNEDPNIKLNVTLGIDAKFGNNYAEIH